MTEPQDNVPMLWMATLGMFAIAAAAFAAALSFVIAETPQEAQAQGRTMPAEWEAGVWSGGRYVEWYRMEDHPILFGASVLCLIAAFMLGGAMGKRLKQLRDGEGDGSDSTPGERRA